MLRLTPGNTPRAAFAAPDAAGASVRVLDLLRVLTASGGILESTVTRSLSLTLSALGVRSPLPAFGARCPLPPPWCSRCWKVDVVWKHPLPHRFRRQAHHREVTWFVAQVLLNSVGAWPTESALIGIGPRIGDKLAPFSKSGNMNTFLLIFRSENHALGTLNTSVVQHCVVFDGAGFVAQIPRSRTL